MKDKLLRFYRGHKSGVLGAAVGVAAGLILLLLGFWKTMFLLFCGLLGFTFGKIYVSDTPLGQTLRRVFHNREDHE